MGHTSVLVLGASGMLGSMVTDVLSRDRRLLVTATVRSADFARVAEARLPNVVWKIFDASDDNGLHGMVAALGDVRWVINCIGVIKPYIRDDRPCEIERAVRINALLPHRLGLASQALGFRAIQIATDCVYSGTRGGYSETDPHDPIDVYGKTKSLGERVSGHVNTIRTSIIGPEPRGHASLLEWLLHHARGAALNGFRNHKWNGVTTLHFAKVCHGIITASSVLPPLQHLVPTDVISKDELLRAFAVAYERSDMRIATVDATTSVDRTLITANEQTNLMLWRVAGYPEPPTIRTMIRELRDYHYRFVGLT